MLRFAYSLPCDPDDLIYKVEFEAILTVKLKKYFLDPLRIEWQNEKNAVFYRINTNILKKDVRAADPLRKKKELIENERIQEKEE